MSGYSKWDRDAYIERVGGAEEAERRHRAVTARVDAYRLAEIRKQVGLTQTELAERMGVTKGRVSQIEQGKVFTVDAIARYVAALGGRLNLIADFGDHTYKVGGAEQLKAS
ncbi:helix-turn-helix transcriptional regulator [Planomonospora sp. ID67723]|uniref:helix-turn-helix domain-containing protein n=1 Tax=Planomonospora sp. ID67723 TaxID=2738134 RepID=UPI0018C3BEF4|nr:helix-turn-helix domain-containing protein [Planomonospora sp. ID67723]MBG0832163.1 helix-turn-helix transcriptional regulator [Planomonospora sp. ID67723]